MPGCAAIRSPLPRRCTGRRRIFPGYRDEWSGQIRKRLRIPASYVIYDRICAVPAGTGTISVVTADTENGTHKGRAVRALWRLMASLRLCTRRCNMRNHTKGSYVMRHAARVVIILSFILFGADTGSSEETSLTLPTADSTSSFRVYNSASANLFTVRGDLKVGIRQPNPRAELEVGGTDGILCTGTMNSGTVRALGAGVRFHWYPRKGAFRVGMAESSYWDDNGTSTPNLALYSIAMGYQPRATGVASTAIGAYNRATGDYSLALGSYNQATASHAVAIGTQAFATGIYSFALGCGADTNGKDGSFVIGDDTYFQTAYASNDNQLTMRFSGGTVADDSSAPDYVAGERKAYRFWTSYPDCAAGVYMNHGDSSWRSYCSRDLKENFAPVDGEELLGKIRDLPVTQWNYKAVDPSVKFIGPVAEDFWDAFRLGGTDNKGISNFAIAGVNMAGVKALEKRTGDMKEEMAEMKGEIDRLRAEIASLRAQLAAACGPRLAAR